MTGQTKRNDAIVLAVLAVKRTAKRRLARRKGRHGRVERRLCPKVTDHDVTALRQLQQRCLGRVVVEEAQWHIWKLREICEGGLRREGDGAIRR